MIGYRIIPNIILDNGNIEELMRGIYNYIPPYKRLNFKSSDSDLICLQRQKVLEIVISKEDIEFNYFTEDKTDKEIWYKYYNGVTMEELNRNRFIMMDARNYLVGEMELKNHYFLALNTNKQDIEPLGSILDIQKLLSKDEEVIIHHIIVPCEPEWGNEWEKAYAQYRANILPKKRRFDKKSIGVAIAGIGGKIGIGLANTLQEFALEGTKWEKDINKLTIEDAELKKFKRERPIRRATIDKAKSIGYDTTIRILIKSNDIKRREIIINNVKNSYHHLAWDNELEFVKVNLVRGKKENNEVIKRVVNMEGSGHLINPNILGIEEVGKLFLMPMITLQEEYKMKKTDNRQVEFPEELLEGIIKIGYMQYKTESRMMHWFNHKDYLTLPKIVVGGMGAGKSSYTISYCIDAYKNKDCVIVFDYIDECPIAESIKKHIPRKDIIELSPKDLDGKLSFFYKEIIPNKDADIITKKKLASKFAEQIIYLINALNDGDVQPLSASMKRTLDSASQVSFLSGRYRVADVIEVLQNHKFRAKIIREVIELGIYEEDYYKIQDLKSLDDVKKTKVDKVDVYEVVGTVATKTDRIMDRVNILLRNIYLENMLYRDGKDEIDFTEIMQENKVILIKLPESEFSTRWVKDVIVTYYLSRLWLASLLRAGKYDKYNRNIVHVITDEIHQLENATKVLFEHITESRKFGLAYYFTCQYLNQFKSLLEGVEGAKANYMLLAGTHKNNFIALKEECREFTLNELLNMKEFHSFNIIHTKEGVRRFISHLPKDLAK